MKRTMLKIHAPSGSIFDVEIDHDETGFSFDTPPCDELDEKFICDAVAGLFTPTPNGPVTIRFEMSGNGLTYLPRLDARYDQACPTLPKTGAFILSLFTSAAMREGILGCLSEQHLRDVERLGERKARIVLWCDMAKAILGQAWLRLAGPLGIFAITDKLKRLL